LLIFCFDPVFIWTILTDGRCKNYATNVSLSISSIGCHPAATTQLFLATKNNDTKQKQQLHKPNKQSHTTKTKHNSTQIPQKQKETG